MSLKKPLLISILLSFSASALQGGSVFSESGDGFSGAYEGLTLTGGGFITENTARELFLSDKPSARYWHRLWGEESGVYLFAGNDKNEGRLNDTYYFDGVSWEEIETEGPPARTNFAVAKSGVLFGGIYAVWPQRKYYNDTWIFDPAGEEWREVSEEVFPQARYDHTLLMSSTGPLLFGGNSDGNDYLADTWIFDPAGEEWQEITPGASPPGRNGHVSFPSASGRVIIHGGLGQSGYLSDTWEYDPVANQWSEVPASGPLARAGAAVYYDNTLEAAVLFGGHNSGGYLNDFWIFHGGEWRSLEPFLPGGSPVKRTNSAGAYHTGLGGGVFFGGRNKNLEPDEQFLGDTWVYFLSTSGVYTSGIFDAGAVGTELYYGTVSWETAGGGGSVKFQIASSADPDPVSFTGPDGSAGSFYDEPGPVHPSHNNNRYFRYRFFLDSDKPGSADPLTVTSVSVTSNHLPGLSLPAGPPYSSAADGGITNARPVYLAWHNATDGDNDIITYEVQASTSAGFENFAARASGVEEAESPSYTALTLDHGGPYYWRVRAFDGSDYGEYSDTWSVYIDTVPPETVESVSAFRPDINRAVRLEWTVPDEGVYYRIRWSEFWAIDRETRWNLSEANELVHYPTNTEPGQAESATVTGLKEGTTYWFSVRLRDEAGNLSGFHPLPACRTNSPPEIILLSEAEGSWGTATERETPYLVFQWNITDPEPEDYHEVDILLSEGEGLPFSIIAATGVTGTGYTWDTRWVRNAPGYRIKLIARDQRGLEGSAEAGPVYILNYNEPPEVTVVSPAGGEKWSGINYIDWTWSDPNRTDTVYFRIFVSTDGGGSFSVEENYVPDWNIPYQWGTGNFPDSEEAVVKVVAVDRGGLTGEGTSGVFEISNMRRPPYPFELLSPADGDFIYSTGVSFSWEETSDPDGGPVSYSFYISENPEFIPHTLYDGLTETSIDLTLEDETVYYWKVTALDGHLVRRESGEIRRFAVNVNPLRVLETWPSDGAWLVMTGTETLSIRFNKDPDPYIILANHITVTDNYGNPSRLGLSYDPAFHTVNLMPLPDWSMGASRIYTLKLGAGILDRVGHPLVGNSSFSFARLLEPDKETVIGIEGAAAARIGKNTLALPGIIVIEETAGDEPEADAAAVTDPLAGSETVMAVRLSAYGQDKESVESFQNPLTLEFEYESDRAGFVRGMEVDGRYLSVFALSGTPPSWEARPGSSDAGSGRVSAEIGRTGVYALKPLLPMSGDISKLIIYPNPFSPQEGGALVRFAVKKDMDITMELYTQTGDLVLRRSEEFQGSPHGSPAFFSWDGRNSQGMPAASGMYYGVLREKGRIIREFLIGVVR